MSLDEADDEPIRFWTYVLAALSAVVAGTQRGAAAGHWSTPVSTRSTSHCRLCSTSSADVETKHTLVLDDYHLLSDHGIHESLEFLLAYLPPSLRVVIAGTV